MCRCNDGEGVEGVCAQSLRLSVRFLQFPFSFLTRLSFLHCFLLLTELIIAVLLKMSHWRLITFRLTSVWFASSFYRVIVERLDHHRGTERRRRHTPSHLHDLETNFQTAVRDGLSAYITAQLSRQQVGGAFTVGDNETYDGFFNGPLQRQASYDLWLVAFSSVDGVCVFLDILTVTQSRWIFRTMWSDDKKHCLFLILDTYNNCMS